MIFEKLMISYTQELFITAVEMFRLYILVFSYSANTDNIWDMFDVTFYCLKRDLNAQGTKIVPRSMKEWYKFVKVMVKRHHIKFVFKPSHKTHNKKKKNICKILRDLYQQNIAGHEHFLSKSTLCKYPQISASLRESRDTLTTYYTLCVCGVSEFY